MTRPKIAIILRTNGLEYDDRVRKECISLSKVADLTLFVTFENNKEEKGVTSYGVPYQSFALQSRKILPSGKLLPLKAFEFFIRVSLKLRGFDVIWCHEEYTFMFPLLLRHKHLVWDQHEIPFFFEKKIMRNVFHYIERRVKYMVHGNPFRIEYLKQVGLIKHPSKHYYQRNLPDGEFIKSAAVNEKYSTFTNWLAHEEYVYLQGLGTPDRFPYQTVAALLKTSSLKICIVGSFDTLALERLKAEFGQVFSSRVFMTGMISQLQTPSFIKNAKFTLVFYQIDNPNNRYCEANRFYQSIVLGVPVICGINEPMSEVVNKYKLGVALKGDGENIEEVSAAITDMVANYNTYRDNTTRLKEEFIWTGETLVKLI